MDIDRRRVFMIPFAGITIFAGESRAQEHYNFDPVAAAKLRAGEIAREISGSAREARSQSHRRMRSSTPGLFYRPG